MGRQVVARPVLLGELEEADEHRRHPLAVRGLEALDGLERAERVEPLHDDHGAAGLVRSNREAERGCVIQRRRRQVDHAGPVVVWHRCDAPVLFGDVELPERLLGQRSQDALGPAGGARRVEHRVALGLVGDGRRRLVRHHAVVGVVARQRAAHDDPLFDTGRVIDHGFGDLRLGHRRDEDAGLTVVDDVAGLLGGEIGVHRGDVDARSKRRPGHVEELGAVVHEQRDVVASAESGSAERVRQAIGRGVELGPGRHLAGAGHDHGRLVGSFGCPASRIHRRRR